MTNDILNGKLKEVYVPQKNECYVMKNEESHLTRHIWPEILCCVQIMNVFWLYIV